MNNSPLSVPEIRQIFIDSLVKWPETKLEKVNKYIKRNSTNQIKRLESYGLVMRQKYDEYYSNVTSEKYMNSILNITTDLNSNSQTFNNQSFYITNFRTSMFYKNNQLIGNIRECNQLYITITRVNDNEKILKHSITCPNCGNIVSINELVNGTDGCSYCRTRFNVSDLYPVVTNYYNFSIRNLRIFFAIFFSVLFVLTMILTFNPIVAFLVAGIIGTVLQMLNLWGQKNKKITQYDKLQKYMKNFDPNFTSYMFEGKMISMIKDIIFSENPNELVIYDCDKVVDFSNIIDVNFSDMSFNKMYAKDNKIYIDVTMKMKNIIYENNSIKRKKQTFKITVARNMNVYTVSNFRVDIINCKNCGASIDVEHDKDCKYCHTSYDYRDYDFVVENISIK